jgi:hypothetical protein
MNAIDLLKATYLILASFNGTKFNSMNITLGQTLTEISKNGELRNTNFFSLLLRLNPLFYCKIMFTQIYLT